MSNRIFIRTITFFVVFSCALSWNCDADKKAVELKEVDLPKGNLRTLQSTSFTPLEIYYDYSTMDSQTEVSDVFKNNIKGLLTEAKDLFRAIIFAKKTSDRLSLGTGASCSSDVTRISEIVKTTGVDAHMIIFPFFDLTPSGNVLAYASACMIIREYRPIAGLIGFPTSALNFNLANWFDYYLSLVMHEITHALVFSSNLFNNFVDANDQLLTTPKTKTTVVNGVTRKLLITPKVVQAARAHFNCSTLEGVELENQGGQGTASSHWEARIMLTDYMIGSNYDETTISDISLALFEDSGWYKVNYYTGGLFRFGKNQGCSFLNTKCIENGRTAFKNEFCVTNNRDFCSNGRSSRGFCFIGSTSPLPAEYNYFGTNQAGFSLADYCPVSRVPRREDEKYLNWNCQYGDVDSSSLGETLSSKSICFMSDLRPQGTTMNVPKAICYKYKCNFDTTTITVTVLNQQIVCPSGGGSMTHPSLQGSIECPDFNEVCTTETACNDIKSCIENKSVSIASRSYTKESTDGTQGTGGANGGKPNQGSLIQLSCILYILYMFILI